MTLMDDHDICSRLQTIAGVRVSQDWLTACRAHLRETREAETADSILHQVLHSDLRDVVPRQDDDGILRRALQEEFAELPESFRLMVQVEELLDVSLNAEARLSVGPASPTSPTPVGNQHSRCLKLYMSDGYLFLRGIHLVGMEMAPIPDLSAHSKAGLKLILKGPLTCRFGIIMCSPSNTVVLGGSVASLMEMQQKALEQAKRLAGVGVDPTVKALIWNPIGAEEEGEEPDEGEHESRDLEALPPPGPRAPSHSVPQAPPSRSRTPPPPPSAYNMSAVPPIVTRPAPPPRSHQGAPSTNPYARSIPSTHSRPTTVTTADAACVDLSLDEPMAEVLDLITPTNNDTTTPQSASIASSRSQYSRETRVNEADKELMSFAELKSLMSRLHGDQELYRQYQQTIFVVPCRMKGSHQYFNIRKKRHRDKQKKNDKYEYVMEINMGGTSDSDGTLKCLVANDILQAHFRLRPGEMRKLSREDRAKSQLYVDEGGREAKASLMILTSWQLKVIPLEEYSEKKDADAAMLQLVRRH